MASSADSLAGTAELELADGPDLAEPGGVDLRVRTFWTGIWGTLVVAVAIGLYAVATWGEPGRVVMVGASVGTVVGTVLLWRPLPVERWVTGPRRNVFNLCWTASLVAVIAAVAMADGGATSPVLAALLVTQTYSALVYPRRFALAVTGLEVAVCLLVVALSPAADRADGIALLGILLAAAGIPIWQAGAERGRRRELARLTRLDPLTGALNRRGLEHVLRSALVEAAAADRRLTLVTVDLDGFKLVNDTRGHAAGDELLTWVAAALTRVAGSTLAVARVGGDEFVVLLDPRQRDHGAIVGAMRVGLAERVRASFGAGTFPHDGRDARALREVADLRLYAEKRAGGGTPAGDRRTTSWAAALAETVDARMGVPHEHSRRVATLAVGVAERLGWSREDRAALQVAALLHDVGKVRVPEAILRKPGPLTADEFEEIARHPVSGAEIAGLIEGLEPIVPWIRHSHEHWDGSGYPLGLAGEDIPAASRVLLVADAYDAMTSDRPYRAGLSASTAAEELRRCAGGQFDPECVAALLAQLRGEGVPGSVDDDAPAIRRTGRAEPAERGAR